MFKANKKHVLLLVIFAFAFVYRIILMLWQTYPPGADIGVHASVINAITRSGNTNLLWNFYQMGGGVELAFPGYHIFASIIIFMTGMPSYLAQAIIVALFSSLIVMSAFLVTRIVWSESVAFIVAFFVALSRFDIEIISWGGYPNMIALLLIPLIFYLFLKRDKFTPTPFLVSTSILAASLFLTHSMSAAVFVGITAITSLAVLVFPKMFGESRKNILYWALPIFIGAILVSPFLASAAPPYLNESAAFTGATAIERALLAERMVPFGTVLAFFACVVPFFLLSKKSKGRFFSLPVFLLIMWLLVPLLLTQGYLVGLYVDYIRFQYFLIIPVIILFAVMTDYASGYFAKVFGAYYGLNGQNKKTNQSFNKLRSRILVRINYRTVYAAFLVGFLLILLFVLPIFLFPWEGVTIQSYYQVMNDDGYQAIEWTKQNTPVDSVFVSDHHYGWWLAGFGQRPTISAVDLQCLTLAREVNISKNASYLMDTDYVIDNGYIQVREDGGYVGRHNPLFLVNVNNYPYGFFQFNSSEITLFSHDGNNAQSTSVAELPVTGMQLVGANSDSPSIIVNKANSDFSYSEIITVTKGELFANMTIMVQSSKPNVSLDYLNFVVNSQGVFQQSFNNTLLMLDSAMNVCGQLIFAQTQPKISNFNPQNPCITQLSYNLQGKSEAEIQILVGLYAVSESDSQNPMNSSGLRGALSADMQNLTVPDLPITTFDYKVALQQYNVSYVANRDFELNPKYADDPAFSLAFINNEVAIFKVEATATPAKG
jgi:hypothetical protein